MKQEDKEQGFTLIEVLAAVLLLSLAYAATLESFSSSLAKVSKLDRHYEHLLKVEDEMLATPLFFSNRDTKKDDNNSTYLEGSRYKLLMIQSEPNMVETLLLVKNQ